MIRANRSALSTIVVATALAVWGPTLAVRLTGPTPRVSDEKVAGLAEQLAARWEADYVRQDLYTRTPIDLGYTRAFSRRFTTARGTAELDFGTGRVTVSVTGLNPAPAGSRHEVWLVEQREGARNTAALDLGDDGDRILTLGALPAGGWLSAVVDPKTLGSMNVDMAAIVRVVPGLEPEYVIGGMQSVRFRVGREARGRPSRVQAAGFGAFGLEGLAAEPAQKGGGKGGGKKLATLIEQGRDLFFNATFGGNGRTCGTCHRDTRDLTMDIDFIAALPATDRLFVAEFDPNLPDFDPDNPTVPAMEDAGPAGLMRTRALTLENIQGFELDASRRLLFPPVFRATPSLFNLEFTAPYGLSDCCPDLQNFSAGAVIQHFTRTLARVPGVDFVLPTADELLALEAFQLSLLSPANGNFKVAGKNSLLSTATDPRAIDASRPEVRGRELFLSVGCTTCHAGTVFSGGSANVNTGVEALEGTLLNRTPTVDTGDGNGLFQIPQLFGMRKQHFFHTGLLGNNEVVIPGETQRVANLRQAVGFYVSAAFAVSPEGGFFPAILALGDADLDDIARFLEKISGG